MRIEHILPGHLAARKPVRVLVVGAGGSGSAIAMGLPYLHQAMRVWGHPYGLDVTLMDGDTVSDTNCARQPFSWSDIGQNKVSALVVLAFSTALFGFSTNGFLPVFVNNVFHRGPETYTLLLVYSGAGSIAGALGVAALEKLKGQGRLTLLILILLGFATAGFAMSRWLPLSCVLMFLAGAAVMASASFMLSLAQLLATDAMRGRVMSVYNLAFRAGMPVGALLFGRLIPWLGVARALAGGGFALVVVSLFFLIKGGNMFRVAKDAGSSEAELSQTAH